MTLHFHLAERVASDSADAHCAVCDGNVGSRKKGQLVAPAGQLVDGEEEGRMSGWTIKTPMRLWAFRSTMA